MAHMGVWMPSTSPSIERCPLSLPLFLATAVYACPSDLLQMGPAPYSVLDAPGEMLVGRGFVSWVWGRMVLIPVPGATLRMRGVLRNGVSRQ